MENEMLTHMSNQYIEYALKKIYHLKQMENNPAPIKRRIVALRKLQLETTNLDAEFHQNVYELERNYMKKHSEIFEKREAIINGIYEPTDEECKTPEHILAAELGIENIKIEEPITDETVPNGIPNFWMNIFKFVPCFDKIVKDDDEDVLKHLTNISVTSKPLPDMSFTLEFHFSPNEYFSNQILTKEYLMKCIPDSDEPFSFDGPEIYKSIGCTINWMEGKDLTVKKADEASATGDSQNMAIESFFNFFNPPEVIEDADDELYEFINTLLETDFEIGHFIKDRIVPKAILYYTGEIDDIGSNGDDVSTISDDSVYNLTTAAVKDENSVTNESI